jgi:hypothetical protein
MHQHPALTSQVDLTRTLLLRTPTTWEVVATVGEALHFLTKLPASHDGLHWTLASAGLTFAHRCPEGAGFATRVFVHAAETDGLLREVLLPAPRA